MPLKIAPEGRQASATATRLMQRESRVYAVNELDALPRPIGAIEVGTPGTAGYRIELVIDEHGVVQTAELLGPAPAVFARQLQATFQEARFIPASKDGRPVRSRIVLQVIADTGAHTP